jgi:hypothetical protein
MRLKLLFVVISVCNFASFILHLHRFDILKVQNKRRRFSAIYIYKKRGRVSAGFAQVARVPGRPAGLNGFRQANSSVGFYLDPDRFQTRVCRVPSRPAGPVRVSKLWFWFIAIP